MYSQLATVVVEDDHRTWMEIMTSKKGYIHSIFLPSGKE